MFVEHVVYFCAHRYLLTWKIAPAIAYGCTCVAKPSEFTSYTAYLLASVIRDAAIPPGVVNIVFGTGPKAGQALVAHPKVPVISFTGGTVTAERLIKTSAPFYKKLSLELGGKNAGIVFADANMDVAIPTIVRSGFQNQGEICLCTSRLFVQRSVFDSFVAKYVAAVKLLKVGNPADPATDLGALVSKEHQAKVLSYIDLAKELGGEIKCGGGPVDKATLPDEFKEGYFVQPTVITGLSHKSRVCQEEVCFLFIKKKKWCVTIIIFLDLWTRRDHHAVRHRGRGDRHGQRHPVRPCCVRVDREPGPDAPCCWGPRGGHGVVQLLVRKKQ